MGGNQEQEQNLSQPDGLPVDGGTFPSPNETRVLTLTYFAILSILSSHAHPARAVESNARFHTPAEQQVPAEQNQETRPLTVYPLERISPANMNTWSHRAFNMSSDSSQKDATFGLLYLGQKSSPNSRPQLLFQEVKASLTRSSQQPNQQFQTNSPPQEIPLSPNFFVDHPDIVLGEPGYNFSSNEAVVPFRNTERVGVIVFNLQNKDVKLVELPPATGEFSYTEIHAVPSGNPGEVIMIWSVYSSNGSFAKVLGQLVNDGVFVGDTILLAQSEADDENSSAILQIVGLRSTGQDNTIAAIAHLYQPTKNVRETLVLALHYTSRNLSVTDSTIVLKANPVLTADDSDQPSIEVNTQREIRVISTRVSDKREIVSKMFSIVDGKIAARPTTRPDTVVLRLDYMPEESPSAVHTVIAVKEANPATTNILRVYPIHPNGVAGVHPTDVGSINGSLLLPLGSQGAVVMGAKTENSITHPGNTYNAIFAAVAAT